MNAAIHHYVASQRQAELVREARRLQARPRPVELVADAEQPRRRRRLLWLPQPSRSAA